MDNLTEFQKKKLEFLSEKIVSCKKCPRLRKNGIAIPYFSPETKYGILAEAPGKDEVKEKNRTPLVGDAGKLTFKELRRFKFRREQFLIINTVQCRPLNSMGGNGKPTFDEIKICWFWVKNYLKVSRIEHLIAFGNYSMLCLFNQPTGIISQSGKMRILNFDDRKIKVYPTVHPASVLYNEDNREFFRKSLRAFKKGIKE